MKRQIPEYEHQMNVLKAEIERLNNVLRSKVEENSSYETELRKKNYEFEALQRQYADLEGHLSEHKSNRSLL